MKGMFEKTAIGNMVYMIGPITFMLLMVLLLTMAQSNYFGFFILTVSLFVIGFGMFLYSKFRNFRKGILIRFGTAGMEKKQRLFYISGYIFMFAGVMCAAVLVILSGAP